MRIVQATVCARPLTDPKADFVGAASLKRMNTEPRVNSKQVPYEKEMEVRLVILTESHGRHCAACYLRPYQNPYICIDLSTAPRHKIHKREEHEVQEVECKKNPVQLSGAISPLQHWEENQ